MGRVIICENFFKGFQSKVILEYSISIGSTLTANCSEMEQKLVHRRIVRFIERDEALRLEPPYQYAAKLGEHVNILD